MTSHTSLDDTIIRSIRRCLIEQEKAICTTGLGYREPGRYPDVITWTDSDRLYWMLDGWGRETDMRTDPSYRDRVEAVVAERCQFLADPQAWVDASVAVWFADSSEWYADGPVADIRTLPRTAEIDRAIEEREYGLECLARQCDRRGLRVQIGTLLGLPVYWTDRLPHDYDAAYDEHDDDE